MDDIAKTDVIKSGNRPKTAFGSKKIESATPPSRMLTLGKKKTTDKENKSSNQPAKEEGQTDGELEINFPNKNSVLHNFCFSNFLVLFRASLFSDDVR